jgi:3-keto-disaccharide hydrolase
MKKIQLLLLFAVTRLCAQDDAKLTDAWTPVPPVVTPGLNQAAPSDAIILFRGTNLDAWSGEKGASAGWTVENGTLTIKPDGGAIATRQSFADCQLHLEWRTPAAVSGKGQGRGNSGIFLQGRYEVQVLDSYNNPTYSNRQASSVYEQHMPQVNASRPPGEWQTYDIVYRAPRFNNDGSVKSPGFITVLQNGVLVQDHVEIKGGTNHRGQPKYEKHPFQQPLVLQNHQNPVSFRNIWIRELGVRHLLNGKDLSGWYSYLEKLGKNVDPEGNFKIEQGLLHVEGKNFGYVATEEPYANYYLKVVFKWGSHQYAPRATGKRDSGILYHMGMDVADKVWPKSIECQIQEGDCGDFWCVDNSSIDSPNPSAIEWNQKRIRRTADFEYPGTEWNIIEVICNGGQAEHYVNGHLVNAGTNATVTSGKILLQSEGAEIFFKSADLISY